MRGWARQYLVQPSQFASLDTCQSCQSPPQGSPATAEARLPMPKITKRLVDAGAGPHRPGRVRLGCWRRSTQRLWRASEAERNRIVFRAVPQSGRPNAAPGPWPRRRTDPDEARARAADKLKGVRRGADSSADRHAARTAKTVAKLCGLYLTDARSRIKASTFSIDRSRIESHVKPLICRRAVAAHLRKSGPRRPAPCRHQAAPLSVA